MRSLSACTAIMLLLATVAAAAQTLTRRPPSTGAVTPARLDERLEAVARKLQARGQTADRIIEFDVGYPQDPAEFAKLAGQVVVLFSAVSRNAAELPLRRVYAVVDGTEVAFTRIASVRRDVPKAALVRHMVGPYREDSFYLAPTGIMLKDGFVMADFAVNRTGFRVFQLPGSPPAWLRATDSRPGAKMDPAALRALIAREYPGFPVPRVPR